MQRSRRAGPRDDHGGVVHGAVPTQNVDDHGHRRVFLANSHVEALHAAGLLIDDRVDTDRCFAGLAVADDEFTLTASDRRHCVDCLNACLEGLSHGGPFGHARSKGFNWAAIAGHNRALAVKRVAQWIENPANHGIAHRHAQELPSATHLVALFDLQVITQNDHADRVFLEVER